MPLSQLTTQAPPDRLPREGETISPVVCKGPDYRIDANGCWVWRKGLDPKGYGNCKAHRRYFQRAHPDVDITGLHIHHRCENPSCVNPDHLEATTPGAHIGHHMRELKRILTYEDAREIRRLGTDPTVSATALAATYGVSRRHIDDIWQAKRFIEPGVGPVTWTRLCQLCGVEFTRPKRSAKFCSAAHRVKWNTQRQSERRREGRSRWG